jgi:hypothetical protein
MSLGEADVPLFWVDAGWENSKLAAGTHDGAQQRQFQSPVHVLKTDLAQPDHVSQYYLP